MYHVCVWCLWRPEECLGSPEIGCEPPCGCWLLNPGPMQEQLVSRPYDRNRLFFLRVTLSHPSVEDFCGISYMSGTVVFLLFPIEQFLLFKAPSRWLVLPFSKLVWGHAFLSAAPRVSSKAVYKHYREEPSVWLHLTYPIHPPLPSVASVSLSVSSSWRRDEPRMTLKMREKQQKSLMHSVWFYLLRQQ